MGRSSVRSRRGSAAWGLLVALAALAAVLAGPLARSRGEPGAAAGLYRGCVAEALAASATELTFAALEEDTDVPGHSLRSRLVEAPAAAEGELDLTTIPGFDGRLEALRASALGGRGVTLTVSARVARARPLVAEGEPALGRDLREKRGDLVVTGEAAVGRVRRRVTVVKPFKVVGLVPPVTSKFTLFVLRPEANRPNPGDPRDRGFGGYNRFLNRLDGEPLARPGSVLPVVLFNHPAGSRLDAGGYDHRRLGFVFLGDRGGREVVLHLTAGAHPRYGEYFHYKGLLRDPRAPAARQLEYLVQPQGGNLPVLFAMTYSLPSGGPRSSTVDFHVKRRRLGFFVEDLATPVPGDMDSGLLGIDPATFTVASSTLHLFGSDRDPSPTLVVGDVWRAFPEYAAVVADVGGDGAVDGTVDLLRHFDGPPRGGLPEAFVVKLPGGVNRTVSMAELRAPGARPALFGTEASRRYTNPAIFSPSFSYAALQSAVVYEPYLRSVDALAAQGLRVPAPPYRGFDEASYPRSGSDGSLAFLEGDRPPYFRGDFNAVGSSAVERRLVFRFADLDAYRAWSGQRRASSALALGCNVRLDAPADLTPVTRVAGGGTLAAPSVAVGALGREGDVPVGLVALAGDVTLAGGRVTAALVALAGEVVPRAEADPPDVLGAVATATLRPEAWPRGGTVRWDPGLDPVAGGANGYEQGLRLFVSDAAEAWEVGR